VLALTGHVAFDRHLEHQFRPPAHAAGAGFLREYAPDILCLQETKCPDEQFPYQAVS
jgi:exonuclease III